MRRTISVLVVVGLCAVGWYVAEPTLARVRGNPYKGQFIGPIPGTLSIWPITISGKGLISSEVAQQPQPQLTLTWGSVDGSVDAAGLMRCTGVEFVRTAEGGLETTVIDLKANVILNAFGAVEGETGTGDPLKWQVLRVATGRK
jgi:hypothetical protein